MWQRRIVQPCLTFFLLKSYYHESGDLRPFAATATAAVGSTGSQRQSFEDIARIHQPENMADMALELVTGGIFHSNSSIQKYIYTHTRRIYVCVYVYTDVNIYSYDIYIYTTIHCYYVVQDAVLIFAEQMPGSLFWALKKTKYQKVKNWAARGSPPLFPSWMDW